MHFCAIHLDDACPPPGRDEEVHVVVPGTTKTAMAVPLDGLPALLPLLERIVGGPSFPQCPVCSADLPKLRTSAPVDEG